MTKEELIEELERLSEKWRTHVSHIGKEQIAAGIEAGYFGAHMDMQDLLAKANRKMTSEEYLQQCCKEDYDD